MTEIFQKNQMPRGLRRGGGMGGFGIDRYIIGINMCPNQLIQFAFEHFPNPIIISIITRFSTKIKYV